MIYKITFFNVKVGNIYNLFFYYNKYIISKKYNIHTHTYTYKILKILLCYDYYINNL